ncbi:MAG: hypothetical protein HC924_07350 [Synechococcaceae cyanobacterium SM2_3_2]|nr:hypothetical protein [Synechococcaceae cyanobacterium SM2_3_2]
MLRQSPVILIGDPYTFPEMDPSGQIRTPLDRHGWVTESSTHIRLVDLLCRPRDHHIVSLR